MLALVTTIDAVRRWRRSSGVERLQFRWFATAVATFPILFLVSEVVSETIAAAWSFDPVVIAFFVGLNGIAAAIGVAVTRYRLWEIDRLGNRTLVYATVTVVLAATYVAGVVGAQAILPTGGSDLAVAASTLTVAALFGPVRRRVQRFVDRRFDRSRYDAARTIDRFASRVRQQVDVDVLAQEVLAAVGSTLRPAHAGIWFPSRPASVTFSERPPATMPSTDR